MSQVSLKEGEIKGIKGSINKLKQEMQERMKEWLNFKRRMDPSRKG
jgi:hypothetical protein